MAFACNAGMVELAKLGAGEAASAWTHIALGDDTGGVAASTGLIDEIITAEDAGLARKAATMSTETTTVTSDTIQATKTFTASGTVVVSEAGVFNSATEAAGDMLMYGELSPSASMVASDQLTITMKVQIKAAA